MFSILFFGLGIGIVVLNLNCGSCLEVFNWKLYFSEDVGLEDESQIAPRLLVARVILRNVTNRNEPRALNCSLA